MNIEECEIIEYGIISIRHNKRRTDIRNVDLIDASILPNELFAVARHMTHLIRPITKCLNCIQIDFPNDILCPVTTCKLAYSL